MNESSFYNRRTWRLGTLCALLQVRQLVIIIANFYQMLARCQEIFQVLLQVLVIIYTYIFFFIFLSSHKEKHKNASVFLEEWNSDYREKHFLFSTFLGLIVGFMLQNDIRQINKGKGILTYSFLIHVYKGLTGKK